MNNTVYIFWDNSNIFIEAKRAAKMREGYMVEYSTRVQFDNLYGLATANRQVGSGVCVGSVPPELKSVWDRLRSIGLEVELYERGQGTGTEQGVDQCLQVHMLRKLADVRDPGVAVLLTGDGAGYEGGKGYHADLKRLYDAGWGVEVLSWSNACNKKLKRWAETHGMYIPLDDYYESITFVEGLRPSKPLSLTHRPKAHPRIVPAAANVTAGAA